MYNQSVPKLWMVKKIIKGNYLDQSHICGSNSQKGQNHNNKYSFSVDTKWINFISSRNSALLYETLGIVLH